MKIFGYEIQIERYEDKLDLVRKYQKYILIAVVLVVTVELSVTLIPPKYTSIKNQQNILKKFESIFEERRSKISEKEKIQETIILLKRELQDKQSEFFSQQEFDEFSISVLSQLAWAYSVKIGSIQYKAKESISKGIQMFPLEVKLEGDFRGISHLFSELEHFPKIIKIEGFSMSRRSANPVVLSVSATLLAYVKL